MFKKLLLIAACVLLVASSAYAENNKFGVITIKGVINKVQSEHFENSLKKMKEDEMFSFVVVQLDTPGGYADAMRDIIKVIMASDVPVIVFTSPKGAQAASAGGFIMLAAHIAAMAPGTEIGAMHPYSDLLDFTEKDKKGDPKGVMEKKVLNDTVAYAKSIAQKRGRNVKWVIAAVKEARSSTYKEALQAGVIDLVAEDMNDLLMKIHNRPVMINEKRVVLKTAGVTRQDFEMDWKQMFINYLADPRVIQILFIIALVGLGIEFKNPGMIVPGLIGALSLFMFLLGSMILPINGLGLVLMVLAVVLFILELNFVSYGLLTIGGIISFVLGSMILFDSPLPGGNVPVSYIITTLLCVLGFVFIALRAVVKVHLTKVTTGIEGLVGEKGVVLRDFTGRGKIKIHGEIWNAFSEESVVRDENVIVTDFEGMTLHVKKE